MGLALAARCASRRAGDADTRPAGARAVLQRDSRGILTVRLGEQAGPAAAPAPQVLLRLFGMRVSRLPGSSPAG
jgi:hypothetical protein